MARGLGSQSSSKQNEIVLSLGRLIVCVQGTSVPRAMDVRQANGQQVARSGHTLELEVYYSAIPILNPLMRMSDHYHGI